jgi:hypothetical protein
MPQQIKHMPPNWQAPKFTSMDSKRIHFMLNLELANLGAYKPKSMKLLPILGLN